MAELPLLRRFPALARLARAQLGRFPTPVQTLRLPSGKSILLKRDDLTSDALGGNKVRALEWILGDVKPGDDVVTVGALGSTHALATAIHAGRLGATTSVVRWHQEMNPAARVVERRLRASARVIDARLVPLAFAVAGVLRVRGARWVPAGGTSPRSVLGHANAAMELAEQIASGECARPDVVVVPLGTGGTAAGIALGLRIAGVGIRTIGVRVVPRVVARVGRVVRLANACARIVERAAGSSVPRVSTADIEIDHRFYGGAYGRALDSPEMPDDALAAAGVRLDDTYSRKAFMGALARNDRRVLFWVTFDGRVLQD